MAKVLKVVADNSGQDSCIGKSFTARRKVYVEMNVYVPSAAMPSGRSSYLSIIGDNPDRTLTNLLEALSMGYDGTDYWFQWDRHTGVANTEWPIDTWFKVMYLYQHLYNGGSGSTKKALNSWQDGTAMIIDGQDSGLNINESAIIVGLFDSSAYNSTNFIYIDNLKIGTEWGLSDIHSDDFESGSLSGYTVGSGNVSIITDPTGGVSSPPGLDYAAKCDATSADSYVRYNNLQHFPDDCYFEFEYFIPQDTLDNNAPDAWLGNILSLHYANTEDDPFTEDTFGEFNLYIETGDLVNPADWDFWWDATGDGPLADGVTGDTWHTCRLRWNKTGGEYTLTLDGTAHGPFSDATMTHQIMGVRFGIFRGNNAATTEFYVRNVKIGTSAGGTEIFADSMDTWNDLRGFTHFPNVTMEPNPDSGGPTDYTDADTEYLKLIPLTTDEGIDDGKLVPLTFKVSGVDAPIYADAATKRLLFTITGHDCYAHPTPEYHLDVFKRWDMGFPFARWEVTDLRNRWRLDVIGTGRDIPC